MIMAVDLSWWLEHASYDDCLNMASLNSVVDRLVHACWNRLFMAWWTNRLEQRCWKTTSQLNHVQACQQAKTSCVFLRVYSTSTISRLLHVILLFLLVLGFVPAAPRWAENWNCQSLLISRIWICPRRKPSSFSLSNVHANRPLMYSSWTRRKAKKC